MKFNFALAIFAVLLSGTTVAAPVNYVIDPEHTFPSFEADHMGVSMWRGKLNKSAGKVTLDKATGQGTVDVALELASIDFGHDKLNSWATSSEFFDIAQYPQTTYKGKFDGMSNGSPSRIIGELTLHGVTKPVNLTINSLKCIVHPMLKRELCGADALGTFNRDEFGLDAGKPYGFRMDVTLRIQVEAIATE